MRDDQIYLDPTNDIAFKKIFGNENKKEILISFLNNILELQGNKLITDITILNPYQVPKIAELKETILDVRCKDKRGISYIVEMQIAKPSAFDKRILYYTSKAYVSQIEIGDDYPILNQVIFLGILYFEMFEGKHYVSNHLILDEKTFENRLKDFRFCFVELPKFNKTEDELETIEDKWIFFLKNAKNLKVIPQKLQEKEIKEAFEVLNRFNWTKEELEIYDTIAVYRQDERGRIEQARIEGRFEEKKEIAKNLLLANVDIEIIIKTTGLSKKEIENLKKI
jgi:predicted transposase/invertase (TIGR01784 family)